MLGASLETRTITGDMAARAAASLGLPVAPAPARRWWQRIPRWASFGTAALLLALALALFAPIHRLVGAPLPVVGPPGSGTGDRVHIQADSPAL
jgi:hypothetical protein